MQALSRRVIPYTRIQTKPFSLIHTFVLYGLVVNSFSPPWWVWIIVGWVYAVLSILVWVARKEEVPTEPVFEDHPIDRDIYKDQWKRGKLS